MAESLASSSVLTLRTAFSRDQPHKIYVQHLLATDASILWSLIHEHGAHFYVCGDARYMAHDVHHALSRMISEQGHMTGIDAQTYLEGLESTGRYQKDVWVA